MARADITEVAEGDTAASRLVLMTAFAEATHDALFSVDAELRIGAWNRHAERVTGHRAEDIAGRSVSTLFAAHIRAEVRSLFEAVLAGDRVDLAEIEIERKDGMPVPIALSLRPLHDGRGRCTGCVGAARDVTEQRLAQAALAETETRLREAEAMAHAGRWLWDVASGAVQWSEEMHRIHAVAPSGFDGTVGAHLAAVHVDDRPSVRGAMAIAVETGRPLDVEYRIVRPDGEERRLYARAEPSFGSGGAVVGLRGFAQDITDRGVATP
jgi:PAS domain S-box-containing protein